MTFWVPEQSSFDPIKFSYTVPQVGAIGPNGHQFWMGGAGLATVVEALEQTTQKPLLWATMQFLSGVPLHGKVEISVDVPVSGKTVSQVSAETFFDDRVVHKIMGSLGGRDVPVHEQHVHMPNVPGPAASRLLENQGAYHVTGNLTDQLERREAFADEAKGLQFLWMRCPDHHAPRVGLLAIMADYLMGVHDYTREGASLDNSIRIAALPSTEWVLNVYRMDVCFRGAVHCSFQQFGEDGTFLASGGQTGLVSRAKL